MPDPSSAPRGLPFPSYWSASANDEIIAKYEDPAEPAEGDEPLEHFNAEFLRQCKQLGVTPHPSILPEFDLLHGGEEEAVSSKAPAAEPEDVTTLRVMGRRLDTGSFKALANTMASVKTLTTISLWNAGLSADSVRALAAAIKGSPLQRLSIDFNPLGSDEDTAAFGDLLAADSPVNVLSLRQNKISDTAGAALFEQLKGNKSLLALNLFDNDIAEGGVAALSQVLLSGGNKTLVALSLCKNKIGTEGGKALAYTVGPKPLDADEAKAAKANGWSVQALKTGTFREPAQGLKSLNLSLNQIGDEACTAFAGVFSPDVDKKVKAKVETVVLRDNPFSPEVHAQLLARAPTIQVQPLPKKQGEGEEEGEPEEDV